VTSQNLQRLRASLGHSATAELLVLVGQTEVL